MLVLLRYAALSYGIAATEWALNPEFLFLRFIALRHAPEPLTMIVWFAVMIALAVCWLGVVVMGFLKCGWPAIFLLLSIPYGLRLFMSLDFLSAFCLFGHECP